MGVRLTGVSTPVGGLTWEYTDSKEQSIIRPLVPDQKIKVFISSICGDKGKYDHVRASLKLAIENTQLADVYLFEKKEASSLPADSHYIFALEDSDICIFLIDNADGVTPGVQAEVETVKKHNIKALYYFCDEHSKEKTALERSVKGSNRAKSKTIHKFDELSQDGAQALINDIIAIYHYYCAGKLVLRPEENSNDEFQSVNIVGTEKLPMPTVPKTVLKNIDKCKSYILKFVTGHAYTIFPDETEHTSEIDEWCLQFLPVLLEGKSIRQFNTSLFLDALKERQTEEYNQIVQIRWKAIQAYFLGDVSKCIEHLENALKHAKETKQPIWVIKDILIDLRNQYLVLDTINNRYSESAAQKELTESSEEVYYPVLDRIHESLHEKYIDELYKMKTGSPYSVTIGNDLGHYGELLASSLIISMYNASLTHILLFYDKIRDFLFYLSNKFDDWVFRRDLLKLAIYARREKEIKGIQDSYPEVLNNLSADDAAEIMKFCNNHPLKHKQLISQLLAFGAVGYYLSDECYNEYETVLVSEIKAWLNDKNAVLDIGNSIFKCLSGVSYRMAQDVLAEICCLFIENHYSRWYVDMFKFIATHIDLRKMSSESANRLIHSIIAILESDTECTQINYAPAFLCVMRKQSHVLTEELDKTLKEKLPDYYNGTYKLETVEMQQNDLSKVIQRFTQRIQSNNERQGKNGTFFGYGTRNIATIRSILLSTASACDTTTIDHVIATVADTLLTSKEGIRTKLDAVSLLIYMVLGRPDEYKRNQSIFDTLTNKVEEIENGNMSILSSNIDDISLKIGLRFLLAAMGIDTYSDLLDLLPYIQNDIATTISVEYIIIEYLEAAQDVVLPKHIEMIVLQNVIQWLHSNHLDVRWGATRILLALLRNPDNEEIINHQLITLADTENVYIKNLIMRNLFTTKGIFPNTRDYIVLKCEQDANFVVRMVCAAEKEKHEATK